MTQAADVTAPGDALKAVPNDGDWPGNETPPMAIDDNVTTKYMHFKGDFDPDPGTGGTGFRVTPSVAQTIVFGLTFTTANDLAGRDPVAYRLSGSNVSIDGPYTLIAEGDIVDFDQATAWPRHTKNETPIFFPNETAYDHYELLLTAIRGGSGQWITGMQIAEVELLEKIIKAHSPVPADGAENVLFSDFAGVLSWTAGETAVWQYAYFGTSESAVANATTTSPEMIRKMSAADTTMMPIRSGRPATTYYWRLDQEEGDGNIVKGDLWSFTTAPLKAVNPDPAEGAENVDPNTDLSWKGGWDSYNGFDVYFGTNETDVTNATTESPECVSRGQMLPSYDPGPLTRDTTYYWRIDQKGSTTHKGDTWSFTTIWWVIPADRPGYVPCLPGSGGDLQTSVPSTLTLTVDTNDRRQTIHNFGASDCWTIQYVGRWPAAKREAIADLLFETGLDAANNPRGVGLSLWRFNVGAGSHRQNYISDAWRRTDTFLSADYSTYDWSAQAGQRWFLHAAKTRGCEQFIAFCNSPPINMTKNGRAYCDAASGSTNLRSDKIADFAVYLATILKHFADAEGILFNYVSPFNEPNWDWNGNGQEGCRYYNTDIKQVVHALHPELQNRDLGTEIELPEAGDIQYLYGRSDTRGDYIDSFFEPRSSFYIGDKIAHKVAAHSYFTCWPENDRLVGMRQTLRGKLDDYPGLEYWMTEYCLLIPGGSWVPVEYRGYGNGRNLGIDPALWMARVIHHDLTVAEASAWQWWLAVSRYDYKDGLVYVDNNQSDGNYYQSKMLWAMGNFSRFIRPGMQRVVVHRSDGATPDDTTKDLMVSGYYDDNSETVVAVFVNWARQDKAVNLEFPNSNVDILIPYVTKGNSLDSDNLTAYSLLSPNDKFAIPARSVVTVVGMCGDQHDRDSDGDVDFSDFAGFAARWLQTACGRCGGADFNEDAEVGPNDLERFVADWLRFAPGREEVLFGR
jgi:O-glycosyl hydrolase